MSKEPRRIALTTISQNSATLTSVAPLGAESNANAFSRFGADFAAPVEVVANKASDAVTNGKSSVKPIRLQLEIFESDSNKYPEFNYAKMIKKKVKKLKQVPGPNSISDPFADNDDDVARIAKELEAKYGTAYIGRGRSKKDDFCDIGMGYDESDPFIDNTDAYDEVLPEEVQTIEGGFYINCGALEFANLNKKSSTTRTDEIIKMPERPRKRALSTSSEESSSSSEEEEEDNDDECEEETDDEEDDSGSESEEETNDGNSCSRTEVKKSSKKILKQTDEKIVKPSNSVVKKTSSTSKHVSSKKQSKKAKLLTSGSSSNSPRPNTLETNSDTDDRTRQKVVKTTTVKDMLKAQRDSFLKSQESGTTETSASKASNGKVKSTSSGSDSGSESDSVDSENEQDGVTSDKKSQKANNNVEGTEKLRTKDTKLPALDAEILEDVNTFKELTKSKNVAGKKFLFDQKLTDLLLKIDEALMCIDKTKRSMVYAHIEYSVQLPKYFFLRKTKQLHIKEERDKTNRALGKLRKAVIEIMPKCIANYEAELRKFAELPENCLNTEQPPNMPRKKFPWTNDIRNCLFELYQVRWTSFLHLSTRKDSLEDFINSFFRNKVVEIWPVGWMRYEELQKEIEKRKNTTKKAKEKSKTKTTNLPAPPAVPNTSSNVTTLPVGSEGLSVSMATTYFKQFEDFATGSIKSHTNSDTDSVASASSNSLKGKSIDTALTNKKSKNSKLNAQAAIDNTQPIASTSAQAAAVAAAMNLPSVYNSGAMDLVSPTRKTDHSIYSIISALSAAPLTSTALTSSVVTANQSNIHSNLAARSNTTTSKSTTTAHIINLDDYMCPDDILQTSKQLASATVTGTNKLVEVSLPGDKLVQKSVVRRESGSESDGVEIVGYYPAKSNDNLNTKQKNSKKTTTGNTANVRFSLPAPNNVLSADHVPSLNNNNNASSQKSLNDHENDGKLDFTVKDFERMQQQLQRQQNFTLTQANIKGSTANQ